MDRMAAQSWQQERRLYFERRRFYYSNHIPERRSGTDRRGNGQIAHPDPPTDRGPWFMATKRFS